MDIKNPTHPDFRYAAERGASPIVFVFNRNYYNEPSPEQIAEYRANQVIVENHGGRMRMQEYEIAGRTSPFTKDDCADMTESVLHANPTLQIEKCWNGVGIRTFSVGCCERK